MSCAFAAPHQLHILPIQPRGASTTLQFFESHLNSAQPSGPEVAEASSKSPTPVVAYLLGCANSTSLPFVFRKTRFWSNSRFKLETREFTCFQELFWGLVVWYDWQHLLHTRRNALRCGTCAREYGCDCKLQLYVSIAASV